MTTDSEGNDLQTLDNGGDDEEEEDEESAWVMDSLIGFLKSPLWSSSLNNFIDQKSTGKNLFFLLQKFDCSLFWISSFRTG